MYINATTIMVLSDSNTHRKIEIENRLEQNNTRNKLRYLPIESPLGEVIEWIEAEDFFLTQFLGDNTTSPNLNSIY